MNDEDSLRMLLQELENPNGRRWDVAIALSKMGSIALNPLIDLVQKSPVAKAPAIWAISEIGGNEAVPVLVTVLWRGEDEFNRAMAACALMKIEDPEGVAQVEKALSEGDEAFIELFREVYNQ